jgi:hypothetical protein
MSTAPTAPSSICATSCALSCAAYPLPTHSRSIRTKVCSFPTVPGALLVRDGAALRIAHEVSADYLPTSPNAEDFYDSESVRSGPVQRISGPSGSGFRVKAVRF